jgi:methionyl-tRNA formyltransferase
VLLVETVDRLAIGAVDETPQDEAAATYAARLTKADGLIDWSRPAAAIHNLVRGLHPWPHAYTFLRGERVIVLRTSVDEPPLEPGPPATERFAIDADGGGTRVPGTVLTATGDSLRVACGVGTIALHRLQTEGARPLDTRAFLAGHTLTPGDRFVPAP